MTPAEARTGYVRVPGLGLADFADGLTVVVDRTMLRFAEQVDGVRVVFDLLGEVSTADDLQPLLPGVDVDDLLRRLEAAGVVVADARPLLDEDMAPALDHTLASDRALRISLRGDAPGASEMLQSVARHAPVEIVGDERADVTLVATSTPATLSEESAACWRAARPHIPLAPSDGRVVLIGPVVLPRHTACFDCLLVRRGGAVEWPQEHWRFHHASQARRAWAGDELDTAVRLAVRLARRAFVAGDDHVIGHATAWEPDAMTMYTARVWRVPRCPTCSVIGAFSTIYPWSAPTSSATG